MISDRRTTMSRAKKDITKISFNIDNTQLEILREYATKHRMTFTATMEMIIEEFINEINNTSEK